MNLYPTSKEREVGEFGLSISTDLAVAGSIGRHPDNPLTHRPVDDYQEVWFNLSTLVRNAFSSYSSSDQKRLDSQHLIDDTEQDIRAIPSLYEQALPKPIRVRFYHNDYSKVGSELPRALPRTMKTALQKQTFAIQQDAIKALLEGFGEEIESYRFHLKGSHGKVLVLTHQPVDLLSRRHFQEMGLLESHTGKVKLKDQWYTKYGREPELKRIPFDKAMLQIFGDGNNLLAMYPIKIRRRVLEIATAKRWTHMTTKDKVMANIKAAGEIELLMLLSEAYR